MKPSLVNFENYFASMWNECNCAVVWTFFGIAFLWDSNEYIIHFTFLWGWNEYIICFSLLYIWFYILEGFEIFSWKFFKWRIFFFIRLLILSSLFLISYNPFPIPSVSFHETHWLLGFSCFLDLLKSCHSEILFLFCTLYFLFLISCIIISLLLLSFYWNT